MKRKAIRKNGYRRIVEENEAEKKWKRIETKEDKKMYRKLSNEFRRETEKVR